MSDKSFGDHINRNTVKNPLLSSAVTGLSFEDLTHKAVLLPAQPSQGQVTRPDKQQGSQGRTLAHADHDKPTYLSGDAFSNISLSNTPQNIPPISDSQKNEKNRTTAIGIQSKASAKSEDDFDVNEYIARLQGTRYVSAPLHSHLKEDQNKNLEAEEALEEINLNESGQDAPVEVQQSLTADIAQNFSQLPTVLPHVASAVFSSFSNMLSMKSREQTPDDVKPGYQVQEGADAGVPLMGVDDSPKDFGLPPKEAPMSGISSYRIASKKKYAQIPGLSYGGAQNLYQNPNIPPLMHGNLPLNPEGFANAEVVNFQDNAPVSQNIPQFFNPSDPKNDAFVTELASKHDNAQLDTNITSNTVASNENVTSVPFYNADTDNRNPTSTFNMENIVNTTQFAENQPNVYAPKENQSNVYAPKENQPNVYAPIENQPYVYAPIENQPINYKDITTPRLPIITPPPMFSNVPRKEPAPVGKTILPPSVARRIAANQPLIKAQTISTPFPENIFVPSAVSESSNPQMTPTLPPSITHVDKPANIPTSIPMSQINPVTFFTPEMQPSSSVGPPFFPTPAQIVPSTIGGPFFTPPPAEKSLPSSIGPFFTTSNTVVPQAFGTSASNIPPIAANTLLPSSLSSGPPLNIGSNMLPTSVPPSNITSSVSANVAPPQSFVPMFTPESQMPPSFFNPSQVQDTPHPITQFPPDFTPEPAKPLIEPPKATGTLNFRMTKKRPQYYSGPIEGVGDISNNVKPTIAPVIPVPSVDAKIYQGSFFTPAPQTQAVQQFTAPNVDQASVPFDISKPIEPVAPVFEANPQQFTPFDINPPQQSYGPEYNTAFDLSRSTTEAFDPPKQESIGFGIIGSLKSKLSSIDINKIQSTVTTFFDPAYNEAKGEPALQTASHAPQEFTPYSQEQLNFEITVPSVEQDQYNQFRYRQGYDQNNQYSQAQNTYNYSQNEGQNAEPSSSQQVHTDTSLNTNTQGYYSSQTNFTQENIPLNIEHLSKSENDKIKTKEVVTSYNPPTVKLSETEIAANYLQSSFDKLNEGLKTNKVTPFAPVGAVGDVAGKTNANRTVGMEKRQKHLIDPMANATGFFDSLLVDAGVSDIIRYDNMPADPLKADIPRGNLHYSAPLPPVIGFFDTPIPGAKKSNLKVTDLASEMEKLALAEEIAIANSPFQALDLQLDAVESKVIETSSSILKVIGQKPISTTTQVKNAPFPIKREEELIKDQPVSSLIESLSKNVVPVVAVSSVPLFGLSVIIADNNQEISNEDKDSNISLFDKSNEKTRPHLEKQSSFGFFDDVETVNKISEAPVNANVGLSITDVKNVLLIEPPQEHLESILKRNTSSSLLKDLPETEAKNGENLSLDRDGSWNFDAAIVTSKENVLFDRKASGFFDHLLVPGTPVEEKEQMEKTDAHEQASDFNICETCREVNVVEDKESENVTKHLIENINSSIQLSNPVEALLTENNPTADDRVFEEGQFDDISQITEDTIKTIQGQSANEASTTGFEWTSEQLEYAARHVDRGQDILSTLCFLTDPQFTFPLDPSAGGIYGDNSLFFNNVPNNASDEIKAEYIIHEDDVMPRQVSVPSAPPAEEDSKSDETGGLDVLSIEQDAKKDFPLEEEFIIEPSETDDDKIEFRERKRSSGDSGHDTFAGRIEKFKNNVEIDAFTKDEFDIQKSAVLANPPKSMASYFDTGNYAAETHYRNSLTSPTNINTFQDVSTDNDFQKQAINELVVAETSPFAEAFRLPPGFEDELRSQFKEQYPSSEDHEEPFTPETTTQTPTTTTMSSSFASTHQSYTTASFEPDNTMIAQQSSEYLKMDCEKDNIGPYKTNIIDSGANFPENTDIYESPTLAKAFGATNVIIKDQTHSFGKPDRKEETVTSVPLPDPINFFASNVEEPKQVTTEPPESFSRLASYFTMPPAQPDHTKSFFELSQSQNHYRHAINNLKTTENEHNQCHGQIMDNKTRSNIQNLMQDLTSTQNIKFGDEIVKTVHHFSVDINIETGIPNLGKLNLTTNNSNVKKIDENKLNNSEVHGQNKSEDNSTDAFAYKEDIDENIDKTEDALITINTCEYCCNKKLIDIKKYKVKTTADTDRKEKEGNMSETTSSNQKKTVSVDLSNYGMDETSQDGVTVLQESRSTSEYTPVKHHWFYRVDVEEKSLWRGFSMTDSNALEHAFRSTELTEDTLIPTDGGRFDVNIIGRLRIAIYWKEKPTNVRRCSWFYKGTTDARYVPYTEAVADKLEEEYRHGVTTGEWHRRLVLPNNELVVMHGPAVMVHFLHGGAADSFSSPPFLLGKKVYRNPPKIRVARDLKPAIDHLVMLVHGAGEYKRNTCEDQSTARPRVVRRGHEESEIEDPEPSSIDHLLLLCHGVGSACDMRFRSVEEVVEDFRATSLQLLQSHYRNSYDNGIVSRVEVLPISWHAQLHVGEGGVDKRLNKVTLDSIPRLRAFTNHTVLDALFYTSPVYHQTIIDTVCFELNRIYNIFKQRNPGFKGGVSLGGHSLGSVILYDLLCHQTPERPLQAKSSAHKSYLPGTTQPLDKYPQLQFSPAALYALGSPIAIFECIRGVEALGMDFALPTCKNFFNIFHPYDPIAYRIEPLINPLLQDAKPYLIPHHKGRKRMHLELKDTMVRVGADLKQKLIESLRTTWNKWKSTPPPDGQLEKVVEEEMEKEQLCDEAKEEQLYAELTTPEMLGKLNDGRRIDYVLQEAPLEMINEYLFAMSSHVGYWESEDTMLLMLREIYSSLGVQPDCTVPQQNMTVTRTRQDESEIVNEKEHPSTSRGSSR